MSRRLPIDWDSLEWALTDHSLERTQYLDLRSGEVVMASDSLSGAAEGTTLDEDLGAQVEEGYLIAIEPFPSSVEYGWMAEFADSVTDFRIQGKLAVALEGSGAFRRFKNVLVEYPAEREQWFAFRDARLHDAAREWLADHDIEPTTALPKRNQA